MLAEVVAKATSHWALLRRKKAVLAELSSSSSVDVPRKIIPAWKPIRISGRLQFRKSNSIQNLTTDPAFKALCIDDEFPTCGSQFRKYAEVTSLHGYRYITEEKRTNGERIFWICWCIFGISAAAYMINKIVQRWADSPVITSIASTSYPVTSVVFPAVTICTVNKAVNEKLIIQGCRYNKTLAEMKAIISSLVDPEGRNNDYNVNLLERNAVPPDVALRLLRLVAPKCQDYLLSCRWNSLSAPCEALFSLVLTDTGYCCSFNAVETKTPRKTSKSDVEVLKQETEYEYLQKAVFDYADRWARQGSAPGVEDPSGTLHNGTTPPPAPEAYTCARIYEDDLFPGICKYIAKCRGDPVTCKLNAVVPSPPPIIKVAEEYPVKAAGSGRSRGLTLMLDTLRCDAVPTDSFKGLRVYVHHPEEFPSVGEKGFLVAPGMENQVSVVGTDTYSTSALRTFNPIRRGCYFNDEFPLQHYKQYSRSSCVVECENQFIYEECECIPYYLPGNHSVCSHMKMKDCVRKAIVERKIFKFKSQEESDDERSCTEVCLPACNETFYDATVTSANFPNQPEPNSTKMLREAIAEKHTFLNDIGYVSASISVIRIFFRESSILQYKRDELFTWEDFVSNLGGVMGLCLGFSLLSLIEVIYWFTLRFWLDKRNYRRANHTVETVITGRY